MSAASSSPTSSTASKLISSSKKSSEEKPISIKFSIEETKANLRSKVGQSLLNLIDLTKSTVRTSESNELFRQCFKQFVANEQTIESSVDKFKKIEIISTQLNYQIEAISNDCAQLKEVSNQIASIQQQHHKVNNIWWLIFWTLSEFRKRILFHKLKFKKYFDY